MDYTYNAQAFKDIFEKSFTWISGFMRNVRRYADRNAVIDPLSGKIWTYRTLNEDVNALANSLRARGVTPGRIVMYQLYNSPQFVMSYIAPQKLGAINLKLLLRWITKIREGSFRKDRYSLKI